jgi:hypothetical protein
LPASRLEAGKDSTACLFLGLKDGDNFVGKIDAKKLRRLISLLGQQAEDDIEYSENVKLPTNANDFALEAIWVICCSGMKYAVARLIQGRVLAALGAGEPVAKAFGHVGKAAAMETIWRGRERLFAEFLAAADKVAFCESLPWIGKITKYHLAKNYGVDIAKPDVHLQRLADLEGTSVQSLCERLAASTGYRVATVDLILWRACATKLMDSHTGGIVGA